MRLRPCGRTTDQDCTSGAGHGLPSDGIGPDLVINANLIMGNAAESGSGGGVRLQDVNGSDVLAFPTTPAQWYLALDHQQHHVDNVAGWDGAGSPCSTPLNTTSSTTRLCPTTRRRRLESCSPPLELPWPAHHREAIDIVGTETSCPQISGLVSVQNSAILAANLLRPSSAPRTTTGHKSKPWERAGRSPIHCSVNNILWQNRSFYIGVGAVSPQYQQDRSLALQRLHHHAGTRPKPKPMPRRRTAAARPSREVPAPASSASYWDIGRTRRYSANQALSGVTLAPQYSVLTSLGTATDYAGPSLHNTANNPNFASQYCDGSRNHPNRGLRLAGAGGHFGRDRAQSDLQPDSGCHGR